jgi:hypothetical protein
VGGLALAGCLGHQIVDATFPATGRSGEGAENPVAILMNHIKPQSFPVAEGSRERETSRTLDPDLAHLPDMHSRVL